MCDNHGVRNGTSVVGIVFVVTACGGPAPPQAPPGQRLGAAPYHVQVGDELAVQLFFTPELNEDVTVRPDGRITTQLAEAVPAAGRTPEEIAVSLRLAYGAELRNPRITVGVKTAAPVRVYVAGEVGAPGEVASSSAPTLLAAVARAGGVRPSGDVDRVLIVRRVAGDRPVVLSTRYGAALAGRDAAADIQLQPFDVVVVPRTSVAQVYVWVNQHIQQFVPVSWGFSYNVNPYVNNTKQ